MPRFPAREIRAVKIADGGNGYLSKCLFASEFSKEDWMKRLVAFVGVAGVILTPALSHGARLKKYDVSHGTRWVAPHDTSYGALFSPSSPTKRNKNRRVTVAVKVVKMTVTAYYKPVLGQKKYASGNFWRERCLNGTGKITGYGKTPTRGTVAADPRLFRPGTVLYVPGYGWGKVEDRGGGIKGRRLDVFMGRGEPALKKALKWGRRQVCVSVYATPINN